MFQIGLGTCLFTIVCPTVPVRATLERRGGCTITQADRGENQREKSKVSLLPVSPYYTTLGCARTHYLVCTDPRLRGPLTDSGCTYASYFTSTVTPEVKVERSSDLRVEWSSEVGVEQSSDSKSRAGRSSDLGVGWNLEQQKCEIGCPLTVPLSAAPIILLDDFTIAWFAYALLCIASDDTHDPMSYCKESSMSFAFSSMSCILLNSTVMPLHSTSFCKVGLRVAVLEPGQRLWCLKLKHYNLDRP